MKGDLTAFQKAKRLPNFEGSRRRNLDFRYLNFEIVSDFEIRISDLKYAWPEYFFSLPPIPDKMGGEKLYMRTLFAIVGFFILLFCASPSAAQNTGDPFLRVAASYLLELNGQSLWAHRPTVKLPPASLTKIMTALLVLERGRLDEVVTISLTASQETGTRLGLRRGEKVRSDFLLAAALLMSANDACRALAEHFGGHEPGFVALMNRRAKELGMEGTRFSNACGHDHDSHYSCARDLAILSGAALKHPFFSEQVKLASAYMATVEGRSFYFENKNELIGRYPGVVGVKTGFTPKAGKCLVALAERDSSNALLVLLNAPNRWWDAEAMLNEAFRLPKKEDPKP